MLTGNKISLKESPTFNWLYRAPTIVTTINPAPNTAAIGWEIPYRTRIPETISKIPDTYLNHFGKPNRSKSLLVDFGLHLISPAPKNTIPNISKIITII